MMQGSFSKIIPVSSNPALDITLTTDGLSAERINTVVSESVDAAGKATNVSKVLHNFGVENTAIILAGRENADNYFRILSNVPAEEKISWQTVYNPGFIRENLHIILPDGGLVTVRRKGFTLEEDVKREFFARVEESVEQNSLAMLCGRFPEGFTGEDFRELCAKITANGGKLAVDSNSVTMDDLAAVRPWIIKPNLEELEQYTNRKYSSHKELKDKLAQLNSIGIENVLLTLGGDGLIYCGGGICVKAEVPSVTVKSSVGAGDSTLSGFVTGVQRGLSLQECVKLAAAFGTAAVMLEGTKPPLAKDVEEIYGKVKLFEI
ncbi:MAG: hexose kinase [Oscillospiraceae bacterium]|nr:hexose kinase [Oscillospiraceae bacterium]